MLIFRQTRVFSTFISTESFLKHFSFERRQPPTHTEHTHRAYRSSICQNCLFSFLTDKQSFFCFQYQRPLPWVAKTSFVINHSHRSTNMCIRMAHLGQRSPITSNVLLSRVCVVCFDVKEKSGKSQDVGGDLIWANKEFKHFVCYWKIFIIRL